MTDKVSSLASALGIATLCASTTSAQAQADAHYSMIQHCIAAVGTGQKAVLEEIDERGATVLGVSYFVVPFGDDLSCDIYGGSYPGQTKSKPDEVQALHAGLVQWIERSKPMLDDETSLESPIYHVCHKNRGVSINVGFDVNAATPERINFGIVPETEGKIQC